MEIVEINQRENDGISRPFMRLGACDGSCAEGAWEGCMGVTLYYNGLYWMVHDTDKGFWQE